MKYLITLLEASLRVLTSSIQYHHRINIYLSYTFYIIKDDIMMHQQLNPSYPSNVFTQVELSTIIINHVAQKSNLLLNKICFASTCPYI